jgi:egghead protein (zeste-white 4 protein)
MTGVADPEREQEAQLTYRLTALDTEFAAIDVASGAASRGEPAGPNRQIDTREPKRDWACGPVTGHRVRVVAMVALLTFALFAARWLFWPHAGQPRTLFDEVWNWGTILWLAGVVSSVFGLAGLLVYRHATSLDTVPPIDTLVSFRIVSRGTNAEALVATILRCQDEMARNPLFPYVIEVVTDTRPVDLPPGRNHHVVKIQVPADYQTPNGTLYKARALQYALENSTLAPDAWIVHLDEETQPTSSGIKGICAMIRRERDNSMPRIGQGAILYHRKWRVHPFLTLADNFRTGQDFGHFHLQHRLGLPLFGLHGSYIVVQNAVEQQVGFDFGPQGSITEDAFWGLVAVQGGYRLCWVDGYLEEQSTQSLMDFLRQRRRWFQGLMKVARYAPVNFRWRLSVGFHTVAWALAPLTLLYSVCAFVLRIRRSRLGSPAGQFVGRSVGDHLPHRLAGQPRRTPDHQPGAQILVVPGATRPLAGLHDHGNRGRRCCGHQAGERVSRRPQVAGADH